MPDVVQNAQEYLVKLGVQMDTNNMAKLENFLKSGKVQATLMSAALVALGKSIYNFVKTNTAYEQSLVSTARKQGKSVEAVRAHENALKALGKTQAEIARDPALQKMYNNLTAMGKSMALPDLTESLNTVRSLQGAFYELKLTAQYALQWINSSVLKELAEPIREITKSLSATRQWLQNNMQSFSRKIGVFIGDMARGLLTVAKTVQKIGQIIAGLPTTVKAVGGAITALAILMKTGPIGWLITAITTIGDLVKDYENFKWNKTAAPGEQVGVAFGGIWEILDDSKYNSLQERIGAIGELFTTSVFGGEGNSIFERLSTWLDSNKGNIMAFASEVWGVIKAGIGGLTGIATDIIGAITTAITGDTELGTEVADNKAWGVLGAAIIPLMFGADAKTSLITALSALFGTEGISPGDFLKMGGQLWSFLSEGIKRAKSAGANIVLSIIEAIAGDSVAVKQWTSRLQDNAAFENLLTGLGTAIATGSVGKGLFATIAATLVDFMSAGSSEERQKIMSDFGDLVLAIIDGIALALGAVSEWWNSPSGQAFQTSLSAVWDQILDYILGAKDDAGARSGGLWGGIKEIILGDGSEGSGLLSTMKGWIQPALDWIKEAAVNTVDSMWGLIQPHLAVLGSLIREWIYDLLDGLPGPVLAALKATGIYDGTRSHTYVRNSEGQIVPMDSLGSYSEMLAAAQASQGDAQVALWNKYGRNPINANGMVFPRTSTHEESNVSYFNSTMAQIEASGNVDAMDRAAAAVNKYNSGKMTWNEFDKEITELAAGSATGTGGSTVGEAAGEAASGLEDVSEMSDDTKVALINLALMLDLDKRAVGNVTDRLNEMGVSIEQANAYLSSLGLGPIQKNAYGGRYSHKITTEVAEDGGTEYIIPLNKPARAASLVTQMLQEMGASAVHNIFGRLGITGDNTTIGGSLSAGIPSAGTTINNNYNVSAPVTISVQGSGNPQDIGTSAYNAAERALVRTLEGVLA